jgi:hypothetical protein
VQRKFAYFGLENLMKIGVNPATFADHCSFINQFRRSGYNPFPGAFEPGFRPSGRTFFIKASYLFRKSFQNQENL